MAFKIERKFTKDEIIELYLNKIALGHGRHGIESAAQLYFGKSAKDMNINECAIIAALPKSPTYYSPRLYMKNAIRRRNIVLFEMYKSNYIDYKTYKAESKKDIKLNKKRVRKEKVKAPYWVDHITKLLEKKYGKDVFSKGYKVYTTLDYDMQIMAQESLRNGRIFRKISRKNFPLINGCIVSMENKTGHVKAMVGGIDYYKSSFNRVTQSKRQPGSSFKTIIFFQAIDNGLPPNMLVQDVKTEFFDYYTNLPWEPKNYNNRYHGPSTLFRALAHSYNVVAAKLMLRVGIDKVIKMGHKLGIDSKLDKVLSLSLGSSVVEPFEMLKVYSVFANLGVKVEPVFITRIEDKDGRIVYEKFPKNKEILDENSVYVLDKMLERVVLQGSGKRAKVKGFEIMGKTGTTNQCKSLWFCGFSPDLTTVVYVGNDNPKPLGDWYTGGSVAAPIFGSFMRKALKNYSTKKFPVPKGVVTKKICNESGLLYSHDCKAPVWITFLNGTEPDMICDFHADFSTKSNAKDLFNFDEVDEEDIFSEEESENTSYENDTERMSNSKNDNNDIMNKF